VLVGGFKYTDPAPLDPSGILFQGVAYLFLGSAAGPSSTPAWSHASTQDYSQYGESVAFAGDVNHDGFDDVLVGAPGYSEGEPFEGLAFLYYGSPGGLLAAPVYSVGANRDHSNFGLSVASAGDVNSDGFSDIIIGAKEYGGQAFAYYGIAERLLLPVILR
jgi:FG-GAP repeat